jgi:hypothetical protein
MSWSSATECETDNWQTKEKWHEAVYRSRQAPTPDFLDRENNDHYRKRLMSKAAPFVAADLQRVKVDDLYGSALDHYEQRYIESAAAEAQRPTNIPTGELRQVTKYDQSGRPFLEFYGSPSSWMKQFMPDTIKKLANIKTVTDRGYHIPNLFG